MILQSYHLLSLGAVCGDTSHLGTSPERQVLFGRDAKGEPEAKWECACSSGTWLFAAVVLYIYIYFPRWYKCYSLWVLWGDPRGIFEAGERTLCGLLMLLPEASASPTDSFDAGVALQRPRPGRAEWALYFLTVRGWDIHPPESH